MSSPFRFGFPVQALHVFAVLLKGTAREAQLLWLCEAVAPLTKQGMYGHVIWHLVFSTTKFDFRLPCLTVPFGAP